MTFPRYGKSQIHVANHQPVCLFNRQNRCKESRRFLVRRLSCLQSLNSILQPAEPASWLALGMPWECLRIGQKIVASNNLSSGELLIFPDFPGFSRSKWLFDWWLLDIGGIYNQYSQTSPWRKFQTFSSPTMRHDLQPLRLVIIALSFAGLKSDGNRPKEATLACSSPCSDKSSHSASGTNRLRMGQSLFS